MKIVKPGNRGNQCQPLIPLHYGEEARHVLEERKRHVWRPEWKDLAHRLAPYGVWPHDYGVAAARVRFYGDTFDLDDDGARALLLGVQDEAGALIDLCAVELDDGNRIATRGMKSWCLGERNVPFSNSMSGALEVHETVWDWLASGGSGIVILNFRRAARRLEEYNVERVFAANDDFAARLLASLRKACPIPQIFVAVAT